MNEKRKIPVGIAVAAVLVCTVLASALTFGLSWKLANRQDGGPVLPAETENTLTESGVETEAATASPSESILHISRDDTPDKTASAIYEENVGSVVGILSVGKTTNIFGQTSATASSGTGFVIRADGYILTNYHVVEGGGELTVSFADGSTYEAELIGYESDLSDLAVLKIDAEGLVPVTLGSARDRKVGEDVVVIGNPLGELTFSLSRGVISALGRRVNTDGSPISMMQIDAAVNSGNSGGPAFGPDGKVIGVVTAKYASESIEGLGFCIPAEDAAEIASDLIAYGYVKGRASLGIACEDAYEIYAYYYRYYGKRADSIKGLLKEGVYVGEVLLDSPAAEAGLKKGDYIVTAGGKTVTDCTALQSLLSDGKPGDSLLLTVSREGETFEVTVTLGEYNPLSYGALSSGTAM